MRNDIVIYSAGDLKYRKILKKKLKEFLVSLFGCSSVTIKKTNWDERSTYGQGLRHGVGRAAAPSARPDRERIT